MKKRSSEKRSLLRPFVLMFCGSALLLGSTLSAADHSGEHPFLGVSVRAMKHAEKKTSQATHGVMVIQITPDSPAATAGLTTDDVIFELGKIEIFTPEDLVKAVRSMKVGEKVSIGIKRNGKDLTLHAVLGKSPQKGLSLPKKFALFNHEPEPWIGTTLHDMNPELAAYFGVGKETGVLVLSVIRESPAAEGGIQSGDVIHEVDDERVRKATQIRSIIRELKPGTTIDLKVTRHRKKTKLKVTVGKRSPSKEWRIFKNQWEKEDPERKLDILVTPDGVDALHSKMPVLRSSPPMRWIEKHPWGKEIIFI